MRLFSPDRRWPWLALLAAVGASGQGWAQSRYRRIEEPRWLRLDVEEVSAGAYAEADYQQTTFRSSGTSITREYYFVGPALGLDLDGSVYHPNLFRFTALGDGAYGYGHESLETPAGTRERDEPQWLGRFNGSGQLLGQKPYTTSLYGNYDHTYRDYDFFNRVIVDSWRYGARSGYQAGFVPFDVEYYHRDETVKGPSGPSTWIQDVVSFNARNERKTGGTIFNYTYDDYERTDFGQTTDGVDHRASLSDTERFGSREQYRLLTSGSYAETDFTVDRSEQIIANANLSAEHRHNLSSFYDFTYDRYETGDFRSDNYLGWTELRHELYDSLTSSLLGRASSYEAEDAVGSGTTLRYGAGFSERYTKQVSPSGRLQMDNSLFIEHVDQEAVSTVKNERHSFGPGGGGPTPDSFYLNLPNVIESTIVLTDDTGTQRFFLPRDYTVRQEGSRTLIERPPTSTILVGQTVLVDYEVEPTPPGEYEALSEVFRVRLDLWDRFWGVYGRVNLSRNNAPEELRIRDLASYTAGTDVTWRWLRAGAEYEIYDSTDSSYRAARLFQTFSFTLDEASSLTLDFTESRTEFTDANRTQDDFRFISHYRRKFTRDFSFDFDGGVALRRGPQVDQTLATARPGLKYVRGKTSITAGYDYEYQLFLENEERHKHLFSFRAKRVF